MKKNLLALAAITAVLPSCMTQVTPSRLTELNAECDKKLFTILHNLKRNGDKNYASNAFNIMENVVASTYARTERRTIRNRTAFRRDQFETQKANGTPESFLIVFGEEMQIMDSIGTTTNTTTVNVPDNTTNIQTANTSTLTTTPITQAPQQDKDAALKTEYDIVLLALLDSLKQRGDADYLKNAHTLAQRFIIPTFKREDQGILFQHAAARHEQAIENGRYKPNFAILLRMELEMTGKIGQNGQQPQGTAYRANFPISTGKVASKAVIPTPLTTAQHTNGF